jgi:Predicted integral membrane protein
MGCKIDDNLLQEYIDGMLDPLQKVIVEEHLKVCPDCRREVTEMKLLLWEIDSIGNQKIDVPAEAVNMIENVIDRVENERKKSFNLIDIMKVQVGVVKYTGAFLKYMPGVKTGEKYIKKGIKKMPALLYKTAAAAFTGGRKIVMARARA